MPLPHVPREKSLLSFVCSSSTSDGISSLWYVDHLIHCKLNHSLRLFASVGLCHLVQSRTFLEPFHLALVEGVGKLDVNGLAILLVHLEGDWLANGKLGAHQVNLVLRVDLVIVCRFGEGKRKHTLLLQVGLVLMYKLAWSLVSFALPIALTIRAKLRVMMARPPKCLGSRAACSRDEPSP